MHRFALSLLLLSTAAPALAQTRPSEPLPLFAFDVRGAFALLKDDLKTVETLALTTADLASDAYGFVGGGHVYVLRRGSFGLGLGGEIFWASGSKQNFDPMTRAALGPEVQRRLFYPSGQITFNFGHRQGWSYLSAGGGPWTFDTYIAKTIPDSVPQFTTNFGFGARWFNNNHVAFNIDMRFYLSPPNEQIATSAGRDRQTITVLSAGISLK